MIAQVLAELDRLSVELRLWKARGGVAHAELLQALAAARAALAAVGPPDGEAGWLARAQVEILRGSLRKLSGRKLAQMAKAWRIIKPPAGGGPVYPGGMESR